MKKGSLSNFAAILLGTGIGLIPVPASSAAALHIHDHRGQRMLACVDLIDGRFALSFIHSVSLTPVRDEYELTGAAGDYGILQTSEHFVAHGQGLPSMQNEPDAIEFEHTNGKFILHLRRKIPQLIVRTDKRFNNRLHTANNVVDLNQWPDTALWLMPDTDCTDKR